MSASTTARAYAVKVAPTWCVVGLLDGGMVYAAKQVAVAEPFGGIVTVLVQLATGAPSRVMSIVTEALTGWFANRYGLLLVTVFVSVTLAWQPLVVHGARVPSPSRLKRTCESTELVSVVIRCRSSV